MEDPAQVSVPALPVSIPNCLERCLLCGTRGRRYMWIKAFPQETAKCQTMELCTQPLLGLYETARRHCRR